MVLYSSSALFARKIPLFHRKTSTHTGIVLGSTLNAGNSALHNMRWLCVCVCVDLLLPLMMIAFVFRMFCFWFLFSYIFSSFFYSFTMCSLLQQCFQVFQRENTAVTMALHPHNHQRDDEWRQPTVTSTRSFSAGTKHKQQQQKKWWYFKYLINKDAHREQCLWAGCRVIKLPHGRPRAL